MALRKAGIDAISHQPRPPSASRHPISPGARRPLRPSSPGSYTRRPLPPGPGPLDRKGEKLILKPINGPGSENFKPRKSAERSSKIKPLRALHSLDRQYLRTESESSSTYNKTSQGSSFNTRRTKSFDDITFNDTKKNTSDSSKKLQPLNYRNSNFGRPAENLARGGSPLSQQNHRVSPSPHLKVETSYVVSV